MELWKGAAVGAVQGFTEFLPISSSAHVVFMEHFLGITTGRLDLTIFVHLGTLVAVFVAMWYRLIPIMRGTVAGFVELTRGRSPWILVDFRWGVYIVVGTIPAAVIGMLFQDAIERAFDDPSIASAMLLVTGGLLFATHFVRGTTRDMGLWSSVAVGLAQAVAILPGISRSGSTIATGLFLKVERQKAAEFSFLLAIPVILGGSILWIYGMQGNPGSPSDLTPLLVGMVAAAICGYAAIIVLLRFIQRGKLSWFAYYCWAAGILGLLTFGHRQGHAMEIPAGRPLRVMTVNVRFPSPNDEGNLWPDRRHIAADMIRQQNPDVIGLQEAYRIQLQFLMGELPQYAVVGQERYGATDEEHCAILVRRERFMIEASGTYWFSETPDTPGSRTWWPTDHPRVVTWVRLSDVQVGRKLLFLSTHFPLSREEPWRSTRCATLLWERFRAENPSDDTPVVLLGDFNALPGAEAHRLLTGAQPFTDGSRADFRDAWELVARPSGPTSTVHGFTGSPRREGARIDWILLRGPIQATQVATVTFNRDGKYPSDHFPVVADLVVGEEADRAGR